MDLYARRSRTSDARTTCRLFAVRSNQLNTSSQFKLSRTKSWLFSYNNFADGYFSVPAVLLHDVWFSYLRARFARSGLVTIVELPCANSKRIQTLIVFCPWFLLVTAVRTSFPVRWCMGGCLNANPTVPRRTWTFALRISIEEIYRMITEPYLCSARIFNDCSAVWN